MLPSFLLGAESQRTIRGSWWMPYLRASVCCTFVEGAAASLHRDSPLESAQFLAKNGNEFLAQNRAAFCFFFFRSHARVWGSQWVICWAFTHDSALTFPCVIAADDLSVVCFHWNCFYLFFLFFTDHTAQSDFTRSSFDEKWLPSLQILAVDDV